MSNKIRRECVTNGTSDSAASRTRALRRYRILNRIYYIFNEENDNLFHIIC